MTFRAVIRAKLLSLLDFEASPDWTKAAGRGIPVNSVTGEVYTDVNMLLLWTAAAEKGYRKNSWMTYEQARQIGACIEKGERATMVAAELFMDLHKPEQIHGIRPQFLFNINQVRRKPAGLFKTGIQAADLPTTAPAAMQTLNKVLCTARAAFLD